MKSIKMEFQGRNNQDVICIESNAFTQLLKETIAYIEKTHALSMQNTWIQPAQVKKLLGISSNGTLQKLRDEGKIRFSQPTHKIILYDRNSINEFIESHSKNTF